MRVCTSPFSLPFSLPFVPFAPFVPFVHPLEITVGSYNILCQKFISAMHYLNCPKNFKTQEYRHLLLQMELDSLNADLYSFQEVAYGYYEQLRETMAAKGYAGSYLRKNWSAEDGLATFVKTQKFEVVEWRTVDLALKASEICGTIGVNPSQLALTQNTMALFGLLKLRGQRPFIFGNVHIHWDWNRNDVQALQISMTLKALHEFAEEKGGLPYFLCGDFNVQPTTPAYSLMLKGSWTEEQWRQGKMISTVMNEKSVNIPDLLGPHFPHPAQISSAYRTVMGSEPPTTNWTSDFYGCLDYILYTPQRGLTPVAVLDFPQEDAIKQYGGCPNQKHPSDHLSLMTRFKISKA